VICKERVALESNWNKNLLHDEEIVVCFPENARDIALLQRIQTGCEVHLVSCLMGNKAILLGVSHVGLGTVNLSLSSAKVTNEWSCNFRLQHTLMLMIGISLTTCDVNGEWNKTFDIILEAHVVMMIAMTMMLATTKLTMTQITVQSTFCGPYVAMFKISFKK